MITALDHIAVAVGDFDAAVDGYRRLLGREPELKPGDGAERAWFHLANMALEVIAPSGDGAAGDRVRARLDAAGEGMWIAALASDDPAAEAHLVTRRGLATEPLATVTRVTVAGLDFVLTPGRGGTAPSAALADSAVAGLDHFVIHTPDPERAVANLAGRLGLDMRLDRENPRFGVRQLWFRIGDAVVEVASKIGASAGDGPDRFGGLAWRVDDPEAVHARLSGEGFDISELRPGRKPGTRVFTVRNAPGNVPTLVIQQNSEAA